MGVGVDTQSLGTLCVSHSYCAVNCFGMFCILECSCVGGGGDL